MGVWQPPPQRPQLETGGVHVWRVALEIPPTQYARLIAVLSEDELARVAQYRFTRDRQRRGAGRAWLRWILSSYLDCTPGSIRFTYNAHGKPALDEACGVAALRFNMAYAGGMVLYGIAVGCSAIGIDLARVDALVASEAIAEHCFSATELSLLNALPVRQRHAAFFAGWVRKEAYVKARGLGLSLDLRSFDVAVAPEGPAALLATREPGQHGVRWSLSDVDAGDGYAGALAIDGPCEQINLWDAHEAFIQGIPGFGVEP